MKQVLPKFLIPELMLQTTDKKDAVGGKCADLLVYDAGTYPCQVGGAHLFHACAVLCRCRGYIACGQICFRSS